MSFCGEKMSEAIFVSKHVLVSLEKRISPNPKTDVLDLVSQNIPCLQFCPIHSAINVGGNLRCRYGLGPVGFC